MRHFRPISALVTALLLMAAASSAFAAPEVADSAFAEGASDDGDPRVETRLLVDHDRVEPGHKVRIGVLYTIDPDWYVYWRNSGDAGLPTDTDISASDARVGDLQWPAPIVHADRAGEVFSFGYDDEVLFWTEATVDEDASGELVVEAEVDYLACKVDCIPGQGTLERTLEVGDAAEEADAKVVSLFDDYEERVPRTPEELGVEVEAVFSQEPIRPRDRFEAAIAIDSCPDDGDDCEPYEVAYEHRSYAFIPDDTFEADLETVGISSHPDRQSAQVIQLSGKASAQKPGDDERLSGVVHLEGDGDEPLSLLIDEPVERGAEGDEVRRLDSELLAGVDSAPDDESKERADASKERADEEAGAASRSEAPAGEETPDEVPLWQALLLAFLGGMILNLMPCVFPVLAIKVSSFTKLVHESKSNVLSHGMAYTAGIVGSMLSLAMVVLGLRVAGTKVGWGFQFQEPLFIVALCAVLVLFALNLFGVFEVSVAADELAEKTESAGGLRRSFGEGVLAVVLATPCSAPFLGTAVGFALASSPATIIGVFTMLGLGLAAPFVVLTLSPGWARVLPKPGAWMNVLKEILGFALVGTTIWLLWILGRMFGAQGTVQTLVFLGVLALVAWFFGKIQYRLSGAKKWGLTALAALVIAATGVVALDFKGLAPEEASATEADADSIDWREWSEEAVAEEVDKGRVVFVDFTADWCITCKTNERTVIDTQKVRSAIAEHEVVTFKADWTNPDEAIRKKLAEHDKGGVPMYLVYHPDAPDDPQVLPEVLTRDMLVEAFER